MRRTDTRLGRRQLLGGIGTAAAVGLAGCSGGGGGGGDGGGGDQGGLEPAGDLVSSEARSRVDEFLSNDDTYEGEIMDATGRNRVTVSVGAEGNGGNFAYDPSAIVVSPSTTVSWEWTGEGGAHNVVSREGSDFEFNSGDPVVEQDSFTQSFGDAGVGLYVCVPHESLGMKGAIVVVPE